jgi:hypothetical protein
MNIHKVDHIIIGAGMAALGVGEAFARRKQLKVVCLYNPTPSRNVLFKGAAETKEAPYSDANGGASDAWHGVIAMPRHVRSNSGMASDFERLFRFFYPRTKLDPFYEDFAFVPFRPLRPFRHLPRMIRMIPGRVCRIIIEDDGVRVVCGDTEWHARAAWLCAGAEGTQYILSASGLIESSSCNYDDHMVGYFGQIPAARAQHSAQFSLDGHFKLHRKFGVNDTFWTTSRPAHFGFRDLEYAQRNRDFFARRTHSILTSLAKKMDIALIMEALYNKLGVSIPSGLLNVVGHVFVPEAVRLNVEERAYTYELNRPVIPGDLVREAWASRTTAFSTTDLVNLAPGIHFVNARWKKSTDLVDDDLFKAAAAKTGRIFVCGGASYRMSDVEHPSFALTSLSNRKAMQYMDSI